MPRLFAALTPPDDLADRLGRLMSGLPGAAWRPVENLHVTLAFYGDCSAGQADDLIAELGRISLPVIPIRFGEPDHFGGASPRSLWLAVQPTPALGGLHWACRRAGQAAGIEMEARNFVPHLTLAYLKSGVALSDVMAWRRSHALLDLPAFTAGGFSLFSSQSGPKPHIYVEEASFMLARC